LKKNKKLFKVQFPLIIMELTKEEQEILYNKYKKEGMTEEECVETLKFLLAK